MKYAIKRHYFNMIEVALALAIIAIGLSSILVLFPVGLNANKSSIANNNLADVAEYMIGYLRAYTIANWNSDGSNSFIDKTDLSTTKPTGEFDKTIPADDDWASFGNKQDDITRLKQLKNNKAVYLYQQISQLEDANGNKVDVPDFSAIIKIWLDDNYEFYVYSPTNDTYKKASDIETKANLKKYIIALCMEISWPAEVPEANREKKIFRFEIFNDSYDQANQKSTP